MLQNNVTKLLYEILILIVPKFKLFLSAQSKPFENCLKQTLVQKSLSKLCQSWVHDLASQKPDDFHEQAFIVLCDAEILKLIKMWA